LTKLPGYNSSSTLAAAVAVRIGVAIGAGLTPEEYLLLGFGAEAGMLGICFGCVVV
jgi:hypothetical protein